MILMKNQRLTNEKTVNVSHYLHSNSDKDSNKTYVGTTDDSTKHHFYNDNMTHFYQMIVLSLQRIYFCSNVIKYFLGIIPKFVIIIC